MTAIPTSRILSCAVFIAGALFIAASSVSAADKASAAAKRDEQIEARFKKADADGNGKLTLAEAKAGMPRVAKNFDKIKTGDHDYVTLDEIKAAASKQ